MPRPRNVFSVAALVCALFAFAQPAGAASFPGVKRDGTMYVPVRALASAFGVELHSVRGLRALLLKAGERSACVSFDETCAVPDVPHVRGIYERGETYVPLDAARRALGLPRDAKPEVAFAAAPGAEARDSMPLRTYKFSPAGSRRITELVELVPAKTALVVIDFWEDHRNDNPAYDNAAALIFLARRRGIPVLHLPHEGMLNPRILPLPEHEPVLQGNQSIEKYLRAKLSGVDTLLFAGFTAAECVLFTRRNSMNNVALRNDHLNLVLVKDATTGQQWQYEFAVNAAETRYRTTTIADLAAATGDDARAADAPIPVEAPWSYRFDDHFGSKFDPARSALLLINAWDTDSDAQWLARVKENTAKNLVPLLAFARANGMRVVHVPNGRAIDRAVAPLPDELVAASETDIRRYLAAQRVTTVLHAGNLINTTPLFAPLHPWSFTNSFRPAVMTRILADCVIVYETPASMPDRFQRVFLERAVIYGGEQHLVSTFALLQKNMPQTKEPGRETHPGSVK